MARKLVLAFVVLAITRAAFAIPECTTNCGSGHIFVNDAGYPFVEDILNTPQVVGGTWKTLITGCTALNYEDIRGNQPFNLITRGYVMITGVSGAASGARYELKLFVDDVEVAGVTRAFKQDRLTGQWLVPQAEILASTQQGLGTTGDFNYRYELRARMFDAGQFTVHDVYINAQGVPMGTYPATRATDPTLLTLGTTLTRTTPEIRIDNTTGANFDLVPQAHWQYQGGTPGTRLESFFRLTEIGGLGRVIESERTNVYVPCAVLSGGQCSFPNAPTDSATLLGRYLSVPAGSWNLAAYTTATAAGTKLAWRYIDYQALPPQTFHHTEGGRTYYRAAKNGVYNGITQVVDTATAAQSEQPRAVSGGCAWTKVLEMSMPYSADGLDENWSGVLYMDLWRDGSGTFGNWNHPGIDILLQSETGAALVDFGNLHSSLPPDGYGFFVFTSAMLWGNNPGNAVKVFVRKQSCSSNAKFEVRNRYLDLKLIPSESACYVFPGRYRADFNTDGITDLVWRNSVGDNAVWLMNGFNLTGVPLSPASTNWQVGGVDDFNGDGNADLVWLDTVSREIVVWLLNGTTVSTSGVAAIPPSGWSIQGTGDVNGDGKADIILQHADSRQVYVWLMNGTSVGASGLLGTPPAEWQILGVGDADGNGRSDLFLRNTSTNELVVWFLNGMTIAGTASVANPPPAWSMAGVGDFNADGKADLSWRNTSSGDVVVWLLNDGTITATGYVANVGSSSSWQPRAVGDMNGDGRADLVWRNSSTGENALWLMNGIQPPVSQYLVPVPGQSWSIVGPK